MPKYKIRSWAVKRTGLSSFSAPFMWRGEAENREQAIEIARKEFESSKDYGLAKGFVLQEFLKNELRYYLYRKY